ncbi:MAG: M23 family metallopeptidase [Candidatus Eremiobacteraeota bacterium]|nr:M23 family metallopeptidase [Candidatus Eremiobacteraeota bacterium]
MMVKDRYFIKIVPRGGNAIHRFELTRRNIIGAAVSLVIAAFAALGIHAYQLKVAQTQLQALQALTATQNDQLKAIDSQTARLKSQLSTVQQQNRQIQQLIGIKSGPASKPRPARTKLARIESRSQFSGEAAGVRLRLNDLSNASSRSSEEAASLRRLTLRILNLRHIEALQRDQLVAAIPSIDPVEGAPVVGCFCYRTSPDVGFHQGVDIGAEYGQTIRAAAAGVVASTAYDGGFGNKVDIDHGNGYHTWYAHLSKFIAAPGERVVKGQPIGLVGSTGFSTGPHLHYQVMLNGTAIDPTPFLAGVPPKVLAALP